MVLRFSFATFILYFIAAVILKATAFQHCGRTNNGKSKDCSGQGFTAIPYQQLNEESFEILELSYNNLTYLNTTGFNNITSRNLITIIYLNNNKISKIPHRVFYEVPNLKELNLANNLETNIGTQFCHLQNLEIVVLDNTIVTFTSHNSFSCLKNLKLLSMRNCSLSKLPVNIFKYTNLEELDLSLNCIENMDDIDLPKQTLEMERYHPPEKVHDSTIDSGSTINSGSTIDSRTTDNSTISDSYTAIDSSTTNSSSSNTASTNSNTTSTAVSSSNPPTTVSSFERDNSQNTSEEEDPKDTSYQSAITLWITTVTTIVPIIAITFYFIVVFKFWKRCKDKNADVQSYDDSESTVSFMKSTESCTISIS